MRDLLLCGLEFNIKSRAGTGLRLNAQEFVLRAWRESLGRNTAVLGLIPSVILPDRENFKRDAAILQGALPSQPSGLFPLL